jgi:transcriptional regulator with XRE-family HTH domain
MATQPQNPVKDVRLALKLTQREMAEKLGCGLTSERRFEYSRGLPSVRAVRANLDKLARRAGVLIEEVKPAKKSTR